MWKIAESVMLLFLAAGAIRDVRTRRIPGGYLLIGTCGVVIFQMITGHLKGWLWIAGMLTGLAFLIMAKCSGEAFGYGDGWMILNLGIFLGFWKLMAVLWGAFLTAFFVAGWGLWRKKYNKKTKLSFFPFLLLGYVGVLWW